MIIRPFDDADREACRAVFQAARRQAFPWMAPERFQPGDFELETVAEVITVAEDNSVSAADVGTGSGTRPLLRQDAGVADGNRMNVVRSGPATIASDARIVHDPGAVVGFISVYERDQFIHHLYVAPTAQGRGAGKALLLSLPLWGKVRYTLKCRMRNERAAGFYRACGFQVAAIEPDEDGGHILFAHG